MKFLGEFPEDMPIFNGVHGQAATEVRGAHSGKKVLYLTFSGTPDEAFRPGGIWKQIDENRELLECFQKHAPEFLERCPWVEGWLAVQDAFLCGLQKLLGLPDMPEGSCRFPRPWPGADQSYDAKTVDALRDWLMKISRTDEGEN